MTILGNRILARPLKPAGTGVINLPDSVDPFFASDIRVWQVVQTGPGRRLRDGSFVPIECGPGDRIVTHFHDGGMSETPLGFIIDAATVVAVIPGKPCL